MFERFLEDADADKTSLFEVFLACLGRNVLMQKRASELVVTDDADVDPGAGVINFSERELKSRLIGTQNGEDNSWCWGLAGVSGFNENAAVQNESFITICLSRTASRISR